MLPSIYDELKGEALPRIIQELKNGTITKEKLHFSDELWVQAVYDFALAYHRRRLPYDHLLRSLIPLFFIFLLLGLQALESPAIGAFMAQLFAYLPRLAAALLILFVGYLLSAFVNRTGLIAAVNANLQFARALATAAPSLVLIFFLAIGLEQAGIGQGHHRGGVFDFVRWRRVGAGPGLRHRRPPSGARYSRAPLRQE